MFLKDQWEPKTLEKIRSLSNENDCSLFEALEYIEDNFNCFSL